MKLSQLLLKPLCVALVLGLTAAAAQAADLLDTVKQSGTLKIALEGTYPPFDSRDPSGNLVGFDVDVAKALADRLGVKPQFIATEWSGIIAGLQAGKYDVIVNQVAMTPQRQQALDFSPPYVYSAPQLIQRANDPRHFNSLSDFSGDKRIGVTLGTNYDQMAHAVSGINVQTYPGAPEKLSDLVNGRIDATLDDRLLIPYLIKSSHLPLRPGAQLTGENQQMGIPFRKGNPKFAKAIDDAIASMKQDGTLKKISLQWFGVDATVPASQ
jgi:L-cystine transport system substrate-binding protein